MINRIHNIPDNKLELHYLNRIVNNNIILKIDTLSLSSIIDQLYNRYYFHRNVKTVYNSKITTVHKMETYVLSTDEYHIAIIDIHNSIYLIPFNEFNKLYNKTPYAIIDSPLIPIDVLKLIDDATLVNPTYISFDATNTKLYITVLYNIIQLHVNEKIFTISRDIFDMLYLESEDFDPTLGQSTDLLLHSQVRHNISYEGYYLMDLLKSDIGIICDIQDNLINEHAKIFNTVKHNKKIIGIHGLKNSGKDTLVSLLKMHLWLYDIDPNGNTISQIEYNNTFNKACENAQNNSWLLDKLDMHVDRFAYPLKTMIYGFLGVDLSSLNSEDMKSYELDNKIWYKSINPEEKITIRDLHTLISDSIKNVLNDNIFATTCLDRSLNIDKSIIIINDLRFQNELKSLIDNNAYLVKISRSDAERIQRHELEMNGSIHISEDGLPSEEFNTVIRNDGTFIDLSIKAVNLLLDMGLVSNEYVKKYKQVFNTL